MTEGGHPVAEPGSPAPPIPAPLRHSRPAPSFLRRQESRRSTQARTQRPIPTALNRPLDPPAQNALNMSDPLSPRFAGGDAAGRGGPPRCGAREPRSVIPAPLRHSCPPPSFLPPSVIPAKAGIQPIHPSPHAATNPDGAEPPTRPTRSERSAQACPPPSFLPPSVIPAKAGIQPIHPSPHAAPNPDGAEPPTRPTR